MSGTATVEKLREAVSFLRREVCKDMMATHIDLFLAICMNEGITQHQLGEDFAMPQGSMSRNIGTLSRFIDKKSGKLKGYDLIETTPDIHNRRRLACFLTKKGKMVYAALKEMGGR